MRSKRSTKTLGFLNIRWQLHVNYELKRSDLDSDHEKTGLEVGDLDLSGDFLIATGRICRKWPPKTSTITANGKLTCRRLRTVLSTASKPHRCSMATSSQKRQRHFWPMYSVTHLISFSSLIIESWSINVQEMRVEVKEAKS